jgi:hypothetical protein
MGPRKHANGSHGYRQAETRFTFAKTIEFKPALTVLGFERKSVKIEAPPLPHIRECPTSLDYSPLALIILEHCSTLPPNA